MSTIEESIDVWVPVSTASEQWTEFELFPSDAEVTFLELDEQSTRVMAQMAYEPHTLNEPFGNVSASARGGSPTSSSRSRFSSSSTQPEARAILSE